LGKDPDGFWVMIEGGDVDWSAHDNNIDNLIGTMLDFDKSVAAVIDWIEKNGGWEKNLLVVTADHDHYLTLNPDYPALLQSQGAEALTNIDDPTKAGQFWGSDSTDKYGWGNHSNRPVPVYYQGAGADTLTNSIGKGYENYGSSVPGVAGLVDESQIYQTMLKAITGSTESPNQKTQAQTVYGDGKDDVVFASSASDVLYGAEGDNYLYANQGNNIVYGGAGDDLMYAGFGKDVMYMGEGNNTVFSGAGDDTIYSGSGDDVIYSGAGNDLIFAGNGANVIQAGGGNDLIYTGSGNDEIFAGAGDDTIYADGGDNVISAGTGNDTVYVGGGKNKFILDAGEGSVTIIGFTSMDQVSRGAGLKAIDALTVSTSGSDTFVSFGSDVLATLKGVLLSTVTIV
jgi:alkaline phosphatase